MTASYQQKYKEIDVKDAKIPVIGENDSDVEGFVDGDKLLAVSDFVLTATATAGNSFTVGKVGFLASAGTITLADADAAATTNPLVVMALESVDGGAEGDFQLPFGKKVTSTGHGFTVGAPLYISATAGDLTNTAPGTGDFVRPVAYALDANTLYFLGGGITIAGS